MVSIMILFVINFVIHFILGTGALQFLLKQYAVRTTWVGTALLNLAVIIGMHVVTQLLRFFGVANKVIVVVVILWVFFGGGMVLNWVHLLKRAKLVMITIAWGVVLTVITFLLSILDRIIFLFF